MAVLSGNSLFESEPASTWDHKNVLISGKAVQGIPQTWPKNSQWVCY